VSIGSDSEPGDEQEQMAALKTSLRRSLLGTAAGLLSEVVDGEQSPNLQE
jgi:hypothetical protein